MSYELLKRNAPFSCRRKYFLQTNSRKLVYIPFSSILLIFFTLFLGNSIYDCLFSGKKLGIFCSLYSSWESFAIYLVLGQVSLFNLFGKLSFGNFRLGNFRLGNFRSAGKNAPLLLLWLIYCLFYLRL
jgi:hypothetical protein